jgi:hypothetical protein
VCTGGTTGLAAAAGKSLDCGVCVAPGKEAESTKVDGCPECQQERDGCGQCKLPSDPTFGGEKLLPVASSFP